MRLKDCCFIVEEDVGVVDGDGETRSSRSGEVYLCSSVVFEFVIRALIFDDKGERVLSIPVTFDNKGDSIVTKTGTPTLEHHVPIEKLFESQSSRLIGITILKRVMCGTCVRASCRSVFEREARELHWSMA